MSLLRLNQVAQEAKCVFTLVVEAKGLDSRIADDRS